MEEKILLDYHSTKPTSDIFAQVAVFLGMSSVFFAFLIVVVEAFSTHIFVNPTRFKLAVFAALAWLPGLIGAVLGVMALIRIKKSKGQFCGFGMAVIAIITGFVEPPIGIVLALFGIDAFARYVGL
jgi:hypothetical protein